MNKIKNKFLYRLSLKLILLNLACIVIGTLTFVILFNSYAKFLINKKYFNPNLYNGGVVIAFFLAMLLGFTLFNLAVNKKLRYLKDISIEVVKIAKGEFGHQVDVLGNDEIAQLVCNINFMSTELKERFEKEKELENTKNELITNISHDLRTPLTSVIGYINLIKEKQYQDEEQLQQYLKIVSNKTENIRVMLNDLFEYTKLTNIDIKVSFTNVNIIQMLEQLLDEFLPILEQEKLKLIKEIAITEAIVLADPDKLVRVFDNVISNAIKYSIKPGEIKVRVKTKSNYLVIAIENKLENFNIELNKLFDRFYKADKARSELEGNGLGLAIARSIANLHNGEIWAEIRDGSIIFKIKLPLAVKI